MADKCSSRSVTRFDIALLELVGKRVPDAGEIFDATAFATAKKSYCKSTEFDEDRGNVRDVFNNFPPKFEIVELEFESMDSDEIRPVQFESMDSDEIRPVQAATVTKARPSAKLKTEKTGISSPAKVLFPPEHIHLAWQGAKRIGAGLQNMGNTCFLNATLQCLTYTPPLFNYLTSECHKKECKVSGFCMTCELQNHVKRCFENGFTAIRPDCILRNLRVIAKHLRWGHQEDAHEFLRFVVDALVKSQLTGYEKLDNASKETTVVHQIFGGTLRSQVTCQKCLQKSDKLDPFLDVSIELKNVGSVEMGLKKFVESETLQGKNAYNCGNCKREVEAKKCLTFHTVPNVLVLQFKRSTMMGGKVMRHVVFTERLNMRPYMSNRHGDSINYRLYAVIVHEGASTSSGHYYCYVRAPNHIWHCMNDSHVRPVGANHVLSAQAYVLFYVKEKRTNPPQVTQKPGKPNSVSGNKISSEGKTQEMLIRNGLLSNNKQCLLFEKKVITAEKSPGLKLQNVSSDKAKNTPQNGTHADKSPGKTKIVLQNGVSFDKKHEITKVLSQNGVPDNKRQDNVLLPQTGLSVDKTKSVIKLNGVSADRSLRKDDIFPQNNSCSAKSPEKSKLLSQNGVCCDKKPAKITALSQNGISPLKKLENSKSFLQNGITATVNTENPNCLSEHDRRPSSSVLQSNRKCGDQATNSDNSSSQGTAKDSEVPPSSDKTVASKVLYNATGKWTVVQNVNPARSFDSARLNATGSWVVMPLNLGCNGSTNGNHKEEIVADRLANSGTSDKDSSPQRNVRPQCETQKWDDLVRSGYKNFRSNPDSSPKKKITWDGRRDQKDFLKEMAPATLGYGAEVVTWDGEKSVLDMVIESENKLLRKRHHPDQYNDELDRGRVKKFKKPKPDFYDGLNPFQEMQDRAQQEKQVRQNQFRIMAHPVTSE